LIYLVQGTNLQLERGTFQLLVIAGAVPGILAVLVLILLVHDVRTEARRVPFPSLRLAGFDRSFKAFVLISLLFTLGNSSDAFLVLRAQSLGIPAFHISLLLVLFNLVYALGSTPFGAMSDKWGRPRVLLIGWLLYGLVYLGFALAWASWQLWLLYPLYGVYYAMADGVGRALVADLVTPDQRGTAYGAYHTVIGLAALPASVIAGLLWQGIGPWGGFGPHAPFLLGAFMALLSASLFAKWLGTANQSPKAA
ncbi:MAG: hypothetical protein HW403_1527, partial [Dehalococcoidia bacterium]|nr:hypothetical protein [Dehalococcoidia bacterium]